MKALIQRPTSPSAWPHSDYELVLCDVELEAAIEYGAHWRKLVALKPLDVGSSRVDLQACKLEYSIVSPK